MRMRNREMTTETCSDDKMVDVSSECSPLSAKGMMNENEKQRDE